jgi:hypothetical protein
LVRYSTATERRFCLVTSSADFCCYLIENSGLSYFSAGIVVVLYFGLQFFKAVVRAYLELKGGKKLAYYTHVLCTSVRHCW